MPGWIPMTAARDRADAAQAAAAGGTLHLYQDTLDPDGNTDEATFDANEADFDDYAAATIAAWFNPILVEGGGYIITMPPTQFAQGNTDPVVPNIIRGAYYKSAGGDLMYAIRFPEDIPISAANAGLIAEIVDVYATGFTPGA